MIHINSNQQSCVLKTQTLSIQYCGKLHLSHLFTPIHEAHYNFGQCIFFSTNTIIGYYFYDKNSQNQNDRPHQFSRIKSIDVAHTKFLLEV